MTQMQYMKKAIIETISETTDEEVVSNIYAMLMTAVISDQQESCQEDF